MRQVNKMPGIHRYIYSDRYSGTSIATGATLKNFIKRQVQCERQSDTGVE